MAEYIEREDAIKTVVESAVEIFDYHTTVALSLLKVANKIRRIPTADVVEVVRCKNCKKWDTSQKFLTSCACSRWSLSKSQSRLTGPDAFCSFGERKEGAEE